MWGVNLFGASWLALVQVHGVLQLFGFVGLLAMGVGLHALPRFRGAGPPARSLVWTAYAGTVSGLALRALAQPIPEFPARGALLLLGGALPVVGTIAFAAAAIGSLLAGRNAHRPDELIIGAGVVVFPMAALLIALEAVGSAPLIVDQTTDDRALWTMLLGGIGTLIFGVWARLAPGFVAALPARPRLLLAGVALWLAGVAVFAAGTGAGAWLLLAGLATTTHALSVFGPGIARQPLRDHARLTRIGVRSAFAWAFVGIGILAAGTLGVAGSYLQVSAARHAIGLGFVTLMLYAVGARALPAFLDRHRWSSPLHVATLVIANIGVALRVVPQLVQSAELDSIIGISGILGYTSLLLFTVNVIRTLRGPRAPVAVTGAPIHVDLRLGKR
ncbi:MAG: NnrS family protein [Chloroflexota bacterium]|nr:NnrS family protein [Chloroflexota bacterium]